MYCSANGSGLQVLECHRRLCCWGRFDEGATIFVLVPPIVNSKRALNGQRYVIPDSQASDMHSWSFHCFSRSYSVRFPHMSLGDHVLKSIVKDAIVTERCNSSSVVFCNGMSNVIVSNLFIDRMANPACLVYWSAIKYKRPYFMSVDFTSPLVSLLWRLYCYCLISCNRMSYNYETPQMHAYICRKLVFNIAWLNAVIRCIFRESFRHFRSRWKNTRHILLSLMAAPPGSRGITAKFRYSSLFVRALRRVH